MYKKNHKLEFEKHANSYDSYAKIQKKVAKELIKKLNFKPKKILDIGCGTGAVYKNITWGIDSFVGVDNSSTMCKLHPKNDKIEVICDDFESKIFQAKIMKMSPFDLVISSSSMQWAKDIETTFNFYSSLSQRAAFSIFTDKTFKTIYKITKRKFFLPSFNLIQMLSKIFQNMRVEKRAYRIDFDDKISMLRYVIESGTSGGNEMLSYKEIKYLIDNYPYSYLEFEVAFIIK